MVGGVQHQCYDGCHLARLNPSCNPSCCAAVLQGVLKVATLPDGATWVMMSPEHQQYLLVSSSLCSSSCVSRLTGYAADVMTAQSR